MMAVILWWEVQGISIHFSMVYFWLFVRHRSSIRPDGWRNVTIYERKHFQRLIYDNQLRWPPIKKNVSPLLKKSIISRRFFSPSFGLFMVMNFANKLTPTKYLRSWLTKVWKDRPSKGIFVNLLSARCLNSKIPRHTHTYTNKDVSIYELKTNHHVYVASKWFWIHSKK